jgi:small-conductance mechanosensitive channel
MYDLTHILPKALLFSSLMVDNMLIRSREKKNFNYSKLIDKTFACQRMSYKLTKIQGIYIYIYISVKCPSHSH